jgi:hypothetical protein
VIRAGRAEGDDTMTEHKTPSGPDLTKGVLLTAFEDG